MRRERRKRDKPSPAKMLRYTYLVASIYISRVAQKPKNIIVYILLIFKFFFIFFEKSSEQVPGLTISGIPGVKQCFIPIVFNNCGLTYHCE